MARVWKFKAQTVTRCKAPTVDQRIAGDIANNLAALVERVEALVEVVENHRIVTTVTVHDPECCGGQEAHCAEAGAGRPCAHSWYATDDHGRMRCAKCGRQVRQP